MRFVIQRVSESEVKADGKTLGKIGKGFMVLIGVSDSDTRETADRMVKKMLGLRIFEDDNGKTNLSLDSVGGELLLISQFTLYANCKKGNRPSFIEAGAPEAASEMYEYIIRFISPKVNDIIMRADLIGLVSETLNISATANAENSGLFQPSQCIEGAGYCRTQLTQIATFSFDTGEMTLNSAFLITE